MIQSELPSKVSRSEIPIVSRETPVILKIILIALHSENTERSSLIQYTEDSKDLFSNLIAGFRSNKGVY